MTALDTNSPVAREAQAQLTRVASLLSRCIVWSGLELISSAPLPLQQVRPGVFPCHASVPVVMRASLAYAFDVHILLHPTGLHGSGLLIFQAQFSDQLCISSHALVLVICVSSR